MEKIKLPTHEDLEALFINNEEFERIRRYLDRFNPIRVMRMESMEIRHSSILSWLLDPAENHGLGDKFLRAFLCQALLESLSDHTPTSLDVSEADLRDAEIRREKDNIDILVIFPERQWAFVIENKFHSKQGRNQLDSYIDLTENALNKEFQIRGIFLTLNGEEPEGHHRDKYSNLAYSDVCMLLTRLLEANQNSMNSEVHQFLRHYVQVISEASDMNDETEQMKQLAKKLYRSHRKALDFVMNHGSSTDFILAAETLFGNDLASGQEFKYEAGESALGPYIFYANTNQRFSFMPTTWSEALGGEDRRDLWLGCENWWAGYPVICWFEMQLDSESTAGKLRLFAEVGPLSNADLRTWLIEKIEEHCRPPEIKFTRSARNASAKYSKFLNSKANTKKIKDVNDIEEISAGMIELLKVLDKHIEGVNLALTELLDHMAIRNN